MGQMPPLAKVAAITAIVSQLASMEQHYPKEAHRSFNIIFLREIKKEGERKRERKRERKQRKRILPGNRNP